MKENGAYEDFIENCFKDENTLQNIADNTLSNTGISNGFIWEKTSEGFVHWSNLQRRIPETFVYDMDEILYKEYEKRNMKESSKQKPIIKVTEAQIEDSPSKPQPEFISTEEFDQMLQQKTQTKYMVFVEGKNPPSYIHDTYDSAEEEAKRLAEKEVGSNVTVLSVVKTFKAKVIVEEVNK